jgi:ABC-type glycerol-3-phosphate transport system substrate-binding protein
MNWKRLFGFCGALLVLSTACSGASSTPPAPEGAATLKIMDYSPEQTAFHSEVAAEYHRIHPNITIDWQSIVQASYKQALPLAFQSKQAPDIFWWKSDQDPVQTMAPCRSRGLTGGRRAASRKA